MEIEIIMLLSVSNAFERKRMELIRVSKLSTSLTSEATLEHSKQLDHFINLFQNQKHPEIDISHKIKNSTLTITIKGQLDIVTSQSLTSYLDTCEIGLTNVQTLYINLLELNFFDTTGIRPLLLLIQQADDLNILTKEIKASDTVFNVFGAMGISNYLKKINCEVYTSR
jgi:anti-anti-sigma factor